MSRCLFVYFKHHRGDSRRQMHETGNRRRKVNHDFINAHIKTISLGCAECVLCLPHRYFDAKWPPLVGVAKILADFYEGLRSWQKDDGREDTM